MDDSGHFGKALVWQKLPISLVNFTLKRKKKKRKNLVKNLVVMRINVTEGELQLVFQHARKTLYRRRMGACVPTRDAREGRKNIPRVSLILAKNNKAAEIPASRETRSTLPSRVLRVRHDVLYHSLFFAQIRDYSVCSVREKETELVFSTSRY